MTYTVEGFSRQPHCGLGSRFIDLGQRSRSRTSHLVFEAPGLGPNLSGYDQKGAGEQADETSTTSHQ